MNQDVTRQILWNIPVGFVIFLYGMVIPLTAAFIYIGMRWYRMVRIGGQDARPRFDQPWRRFFLAFRDGVGQGYVGRETWGWIHYTFIVAFVGLFIGTSLVFVNDNLRDLFALFGVRLYFYYGDFYLFFKAAMDTFFLLIIIGVVPSGRPMVFSACGRTASHFDSRRRRLHRRRVPEAAGFFGFPYYLVGMMEVRR
jgi:hypothetical protein